MSSKRKSKQQRWRISRIGARQQYVTTVMASSESEAIKTVIRENEIKDAWQQSRLVAQPED